MMYISCASMGIYRNDSWLDDPELLDQLSGGGPSGFEMAACSEVFPPYGYGRPASASFGGDERERAHVAAVAHGVAQAFPRGPGSVLMRFENTCVSRTVIYLLNDQDARILYETHRPVDRDLTPLRDAYELRLVDDYRRADPFVASLWLGSAASGNDGHWLVDDLPRLQALVELRRIRPYATIHILMPSVGEARNLMRLQACAAVCHSLELENVKMVFVDREARLFFDELYYVSPVTHHPGLKSPEAMRFVATHGAPEPADAADEMPKRLFLLRRQTGRRDLANQEEIAGLLTSRGFAAVDPLQLPFLKRVELFHAADCVVGGMDTAMTGTVFCREGARIGALAPEGFVAPFFWDLAAVRSHRHATCFGHTAPGRDPSWRKNYRVNPRDLKAMLSALEPAPAPAFQKTDAFQIWN